MTARPAAACAAIAIAAVTGASLAGAPATYRVVSDKSPLRIEVGKAGAFGFVAGHTHEVNGRIQGTVTADARDLTRTDIRLTIRAADLRVSGKGEPPDDVPKVQERMLGPDVLEVARFPEIAFRSTSIAADQHDADAGVKGSRPGGGASLRIAGEITLHGRTKPVSTIVHVKIDGATLTASGTLVVKQTDFDIKPVSVGGAVSVKDTLTIHFTVTAAS